MSSSENVENVETMRALLKAQEQAALELMTEKDATIELLKRELEKTKTPTGATIIEGKVFLLSYDDSNTGLMTQVDDDSKDEEGIYIRILSASKKKEHALLESWIDKRVRIIIEVEPPQG